MPRQSGPVDEDRAGPFSGQPGGRMRTRTPPRSTTSSSRRRPRSSAARRTGAYIAHLDLHTAEALAAPVGHRYEPQGAQVERDLVPLAGGDHGQIEDLRPALRQRSRVIGLDLGGRDRLHLGRPRPLPLRSGRHPRPVERLASLLHVDLEEGAPGVSRVELHDRVAVVVELHHLADPEIGHPDLHATVLGALEDGHVPAVARPSLEVPPGGCSLPHRRDDLHELVAGRHHRVLQPELAHRRVTERHLEAQHGVEVGEHGVELVGDDGNLAQSVPHGRRLARRGVPGRLGRRAAQ
jgi:hypothetical protein